MRTTTTGELTTTTATATVLPTASWRKPKIDVTFEALAVLAVFSFFVLVVGVAAPTVLYFSTRQAPALSPPPSPQTVGPPALYYQYFPGAVYQKKMKFVIKRWKYICIKKYFIVWMRMFCFLIVFLLLFLVLRCCIFFQRSMSMIYLYERGGEREEREIDRGRERVTEELIIVHSLHNSFLVY